MIAIIVSVLATALFLYIVLGGADFGAGILEIFVGQRGKETISEALAPIWEANHVWLVLIVVILFVGFPGVYSSMSISLHLPIMGALIGIILRGTAFTFRHYDVAEDYTHRFYTLTFRASSLITPLFLGIITGAMVLGRINPAPETYYEGFISPWFNLFSLGLGLFLCALFTLLAAVYMIGETESAEAKSLYSRYAKRALLITIFVGALLFYAAHLEGFPLLAEFTDSWISIASMAIATLSIPLLWTSLSYYNIRLSRLLVGMQTLFILIGWFAIQFPVLVNRQGAPALTVYNSHAPESTLFQLIIALIVGVLLVIPSFLYLFRVFKFE